MYSQQDGPELFRYFTDALIFGEMNILKAQGRLSDIKTPFKKKETVVENNLMCYSVNDVYCLKCKHETWTFDMCLEIILTIEIPQTKNLLDSDDEDYYKPKQKKGWFGKSSQESKEPPKKWTEEKKKAQEHLDQLIENHNEYCEEQGGHYEIDITKFGDEPIPAGFNKSTDKLYSTPHVIPQESNSKSIELETLLEYHFKTTLLNNKDNYYTCEKCRKTEDMEKNIMFITSTHRLYDLAPTLCITLKRFKQTSSYSWASGGGFSKINSQVDFPMELDMTRYVMKRDKNETFEYELQAIMVHSGGMGGGHYIAYAKHETSKGPSWFYFSDGYFREVSVGDVKSAQAYMLFYKRKAKKTSETKGKSPN